MVIISELFCTFAVRMQMCSGTLILTALAYVHPQYSYWNNEATRFCLVCLNLENSKMSKAEYDGSRIYVGLSSHGLLMRHSRA